MGAQADGYKATDSVAYKKGRFGDWNFEYSLNLGAASLMHAEVQSLYSFFEYSAVCTCLSAFSHSCVVDSFASSISEIILAVHQAEAGASAPQTPVQPFCCSEVAEYWRWASSGTFQPTDRN